MLERGDGALVFTTGGSAVYPVPFMGSTGIALSGLRNYAYALNEALDGTGVYAGTVSIGMFLTAAGEGGPGDPDAIAPIHFDMVTKRDRVEELVGFEAGPLAEKHAAVNQSR
jgi:hypothetical protein